MRHYTMHKGQKQTNKQKIEQDCQVGDTPAFILQAD